MTITLLGEPKSTQNIYRYACRGKFGSLYMTSTGKDLKEDYQWQAKMQWKHKPIDYMIAITVKIYFGTHRKADWDNFHKLSMDALTGIVWEDDSLIKTATVEKLFDKERPRLEITIYSWPSDV